MGYQYLALVKACPSANTLRVSEAQADLLHIRGLRPCLTAGSLQLYVSAETPVLPVPGGVVIGHLFSNDGMPAKPGAFPTPLDRAALAKHLLERYWGEYLMFQPANESVAGLDVLREPSGGVSCVYAIESGTGFITSDISLATSLGLYHQQVDWDFISQAVVYPHVKTARTALTGVRELLPGCSLLLRSMNTVVREDWSPWTFVARSHRHRVAQEATAEVRTTVTSVIKTWAETDKAILMELSGGLDSSIVATCLHGTDAQVSCCTMVTPVPGADERQYARLVTDALGLKLHAMELGFESARFDLTPPALTTTPRLGVLQRVSHEILEAAARVHDATSFFSGGGGDSVFCYLNNAAPAADAFRERGLSAGLHAIRNLSDLHQCTHWKTGRLALKKLLRGAKAPYKPNRSLLDPSVPTTIPEPHPWLTAPEGALPGDQERIADLAGTQVFRDSAPRGRERGCWLRLPLLSQPVMEACLKVPSWMWIAGGQNRAIARAAFAEQLPRDVLERRSKGNFVNYLGAIYQRQKAQMHEYLLNGHLRAHHALDTGALKDFFAAPLPARDTSFTRIFDLCMIESWIRHHD